MDNENKKVTNKIELTQEQLEDTISKAIKETLDKDSREKKTPFATAFQFKSNEKEEKPAYFGAALKTLLYAETNKLNIKDASKKYLDKSKTYAAEVINKGLNESAAADGGVFAIPEVSSDFIELLTAQNVLRSINTQKIRTNAASLEINREDTGASAYWTGETRTSVTKSAQKFGKYTLTPKVLMSWATISNDLINDVGTNVEQIVSNQIIKAITNKEELAFLNGGGANEPKGIYQWLAAGNKITSGGSTSALIESDLFSALLAVNGTRASTDLVWLMNYRSLIAMKQKRDATSNILTWPELRDSQPSLLGHPVYVCNNISITQGTGAQTQIFLLDPTEFIIMDRATINFRINPIQNDSNFEHGINETLVVAESRTDSLLRHSTKAACISAVDY